MKRYCTLIIFFIMSYLSAFSQVAFVIPDVKGVVKDKIVSADIRIKTRDSISALQFTLEWNPEILQFNTVDSIKLPDVSMDIFGTNSTSTGSLKFLWLSSASDGVRFTDSFTIFRVFFKAVGVKGTSSMVKFSNSLIRIKALNPRVENLVVTTRDGLITIDGTSALKNDLNTEGRIKLYPNIPNPVSHQTIIPFELAEAEEIKLQVYDSLGRLMIEKKEFYLAGKHEWQLNTEGVLQNGLYRYGIRSQNNFISKVFIKL
jgi:Cohesin domain/Secretion system C-terminal sorting domain